MEISATLGAGEIGNYIRKVVTKFVLTEGRFTMSLVFFDLLTKQKTNKKVDYYIFDILADTVVEI